MAEQLADSNGIPHAQLLSNLYSKWANHSPKVGMLVTGHVMVCKEGRSQLGDPFFERSEVINREASELKMKAFREWANYSPTTSRGHSRVPIIAQLNHGGRQIPKAVLTKNYKSKTHTRGVITTMSPDITPIKRALGIFPKPQLMTKRDFISKIIPCFVGAASILLDAGFDGIQLHMAHGYLLHDVLKARWLEELQMLLKEVRTVIGDHKILSLKINAPSQHQHVLSLDTDFIRQLTSADHPLQANIDFIEISAGTYSKPSFAEPVSRVSLPYSISFAESLISESVHLGSEIAPIAVTGRVRGHTGVQAALSLGVSLVGMGRPFCHSLPFSEMAQNRQGVPIPAPARRLLRAVSRTLPLAHAGPSTVWYGERIRGMARDAGDEAASLWWRVVGWVWWCVWTVVLLLVRGFGRGVVL
eukprot:gnl/Dysnectes_brevis/3851_a4971_820.p1 GENE.gnl/Dysnectes_brevis/3851_a4971_820~~gnl/Dysnectes_brevis/3851_a4971_820.p1  ORF type:complete len:440 (+),score=27.87 gnl/Dysnectes_brevis/3851_a4971_820:73-1320(+)